ncbi:hypothetical protein ARSEF4850_003740 [Beauveria asiatica]
MTGPAGRVARSGSPLSMPRRSGRVVRASSKVSTALNTLEEVTAEANEINVRNARSDSVESEFESAPESQKPRSNGETGRSMFQKLVELLEKSREEMRELKEETNELKQKVTEQTLAIAKQDELIGNLNNTATQQAIRSILWIAKDLDAEQVAVETSDVTAALVRIAERVLLVVSVYVEEGQDQLSTHARRLAMSLCPAAPANLRVTWYNGDRCSA